MNKHFYLFFLVLLAPSILVANIAQASEPGISNSAPNVVVSIKPIHSLVSAVMKGIGQPLLMIQGHETPHNFKLSPGKAKSLSQADIFFWIGEELESLLNKPIKSLIHHAKVISLIKTPGLSIYPFRKQWHHIDLHDNDDLHNNKDKHLKEHDHSHTSSDPHIWLDPLNAIKLVEDIRDNLITIDNKNILQYKTNAQNLIASLQQLHNDLRHKTKHIMNKPFLVFHDSYQYFEKRYQLTATGSIIFNPESSSSAKRLRDIQTLIKNKNIVCIFSEPQFSPKLVKTVIRGSQVKTGLLDPIGVNLEAGDNLYFTLLNNLYKDLNQCLTSS
ncbi:MAG: zinc ABC transporter substrate-binding protein [Gammaproteobacteria bacterium]|nr:zinc ABC transporter substrate-binding protein [Gammaproteobacteria bacterium]